ncbi:uncharacterized protein LOC142345889 [Convolutriloba macropyga]|uniref:uncharacterized protein LOC142345889 n=1 Tax=Convolutriloba macropyga TaxID=536237 RepID=UPI003F51E7CD
MGTNVEQEVCDILSDIRDAYKASLLEQNQKGKQNKVDVINLADMKVLMRTLGLPVHPERLKEVLNESRAKDVRNKIELDFFSLVPELENLVEDPCADNEVRKAFSILERSFGVPKGGLTKEDFIKVVNPFSNFISEEEIHEMFNDLTMSSGMDSTMDVDDFLYTLKTHSKGASHGRNRTASTSSSASSASSSPQSKQKRVKFQ